MYNVGFALASEGGDIHGGLEFWDVRNFQLSSGLRLWGWKVNPPRFRANLGMLRNVLGVRPSPTSLGV